jgi:hypothetical protein
MYDINTLVSLAPEAGRMRANFNRADFLEALFGPYTKDSPYFILVSAVDDHGVRPWTRFYPNIVELSNAEFSPDRHVYFGICPRQRMHVGKEHIRYIAALWASLDIGRDGHSGPNHNFVDTTEAMESIESFPLKPSIIVRSGRGFHLYWLLHSQKKIPDVEPVENLLRKLNDHFRCHSPVGLESTLRLPGTWNPRGSRTPTKCFVERLDPTLRYYPTEFQNLDLGTLAHEEVANRPIAPQDQFESTLMVGTLKQRKGLACEVEQAASEDLGNVNEPYVSSEPNLLRKVVENKRNQLRSGKDTASFKRLTDETLDDLADKVADRLIQRVSENLSDAIINRIIEGVVQQLADRIVTSKANT